MAREHAQINLDIWADDDWRRLSPRAQHLYMLLLTSPTLSFCGVADWRPARIARMAHGWTTSGVLEAADELAGRLFLVIDDETEEVLIRSFVRHDGLMKQPNMATAMATAHAAVASPGIRGVVVHELRRLREKQPDLAGWRSQRALEVLNRDAIDPSGNPSVDPSVKGSVNPLVDPNPKASVDPCPTPTPTPAPNSSSSSNEEKSLGARKRGTRIPDNFAPTEEMTVWAMERGFGRGRLEDITAAFVDHWNGVAGAKGTKLDWDGTWRNWVRREDPARGGAQLSIASDRRLSAGELDNLLGMDVWTCPRPPRDLDDDAAFAWTQRTIREHSEQRQQLARERMGRTA